MSSLYPSSNKPVPRGVTEFEILKASHKFLREDETEDSPENTTWESKLAAKYYSSLYREFAVCDLKHYKSGNFALRWRTEEEVLSGAGESSCGNTRCHRHSVSVSSSKRKAPPLNTLELPFVYLEHGETKSALVKVVLCDKCLKKMMWKRRKEKDQVQNVDNAVPEASSVDPQSGGSGEEERGDRLDTRAQRRRSSRSRSPRSRHKPSRRRRSESPL